MTPSKRTERLYLTDIRDAIDNILGCTTGGKEAFLDDSRTQDAVLRNIEIIGEAVRRAHRLRRDCERHDWNCIQRSPFRERQIVPDDSRHKACCFMCRCLASANGTRSAS